MVLLWAGSNAPGFKEINLIVELIVPPPRLTPPGAIGSEKVNEATPIIISPSLTLFNAVPPSAIIDTVEDEPL